MSAPIAGSASKFQSPRAARNTRQPTRISAPPTGIESSPAFVRAPEGNGCAERFIRTLKEQLLWVRTFRTVEELRVALQEFKDRYNREWLVERHGFVSPAAAREKLRGQKVA
jgi:transposase InsO family protein